MHVGWLLYGNSDVRIEFDDRVLAHLQVVVGSKLRRNESFFLCWRDSRAAGDGQSCIWMSRRIPMYFKYETPERMSLNSAWLRELDLSASSRTGLFVTAEPGSEVLPRPESSVRSS